MSKQFTYTLSMDAEIGDLVSKIEKAKTSMQGLANSGKFPAIEKSFASMQKSLERLQQVAKTPITSAATFGSMQKDVASIEVQLQGLGKILEHVMSLPDTDKLNILPPELANNIKNITSALSAFSTSVDNAQKKTAELISAEKELAKAKKELATAQGKQAEAQQKVTDEQGRIDVKKEEIKTIKEQIKVLKEYQATQKLYEEAGAPKNKKMTDAEGKTHSLPKATAEAKKITAEIGVEFDAGNVDSVLASLNDKLEEQQEALDNCEASYKRYSNSLNAATSVVTTKQAAVNNLSASFENLNKEFEKNKTANVSKAFATLRTKAEQLGVSLEGIPVDYTEEALAELQSRLQTAADQGFAAFNEDAKEASNKVQEVSDATKAASDTVAQSAEKFQEGMERFKNNSAILEKIKAFVGLQGGIEIARSAMRNAISTIKELDAVMTEMAVVTNLEVGDYWEQLPQHTDAANELGVAISEVYKAETLYYQQGLKTAQAQSMANETLKMARIAGLSAEEATNKMTAALRGFNMELNETSAQNVADVYSELAAITAADVDEISSAMSKTASIASSAGMEFETTAAFLSQIIETTRESAETAGTALKTVIARFSEVKKLQSEGLATGTDEEGEIIDVNKIQTALRSVGISMDEFFAGQEGLDEIFLKLAEKWDTLDVKTQRYIATTAAGSRQQSRFLAMMSDYARTQELVTAANNSAGASNEQFEKTLDSLSAKLANLKNAWDSFTMGIMDSDLVKVAVDLLTGILTVMNNIADAFDKVGLGGVASIGMIVAALYLGDKALKVFMSNFRDDKTVFQSFGAVIKAAIDGINKRFLSLKKLFSGKLNINISDESLKKATVATEKYNAANRELKKIETERAATAKAGNLGTKESAMYSELAKEATQRRSDAEKELMATMGLSTTQMEAVQALQALDVATGDALILTKAGISAATLSEITAINGKTAAENASTLAQNLSNASGIRAISAKIGITVANWAQTASEKARTGSLWGSITATIAQTMANWGLQASMWPLIIIAGILLVVIGALVLIIWAIVSAFQAFIKNSPEGKLKSAQEASKAAAEAADQAAEAYQNLADGLESLGDKYTVLEDLTRGTKEWEKAVRNINNEVMSLVEQYPELAGLVENEGGVLTLDIESDEVQAVLEKYEKQAVKAQAASIASKIHVNDKQTDVDRDNLSGDATLDEDEDTDKMALLLAEGLANIDETGKIQMVEGDATEARLEELGLTTEQFKEFSEELEDGAYELREYGEQIKQRKEEEEAYAAQLAVNALQAVDSSKYTAEEQQLMGNFATDDLSNQFMEEAKAKLDDMSKDEIEAAKAEVAQSLYGENATIDGDTVTYKDENGEEKTATLTDEDALQQYAATQATEKMTKALEAVPSAINKTTTALESLQKGLGIAYKNIVQDPENATAEDIKTYQDEVNSEEYKSLMTDLFYTLSVDEQSIYGNSIDTFIDKNSHAADESAAILASAMEKLATLGLENTEKEQEVNTKVSVGALEAYADKLTILNAGLAEGSKAIDVINNSVNEIGNQLSAEQMAVFLRELSAIDMSDLGAWENFDDTLDALGLSTITSSKAFEKLKTDAAAAAGAIEKIDLRKFTESFVNLQNIIGQIKSGEQDRNLDKETYERVVEASPELEKLFSKSNDGETFRYLGDSIVDLIEAINASTETTRQNAMARAEEKIRAIDVIDTLKRDERFESGKVMDYANKSSWTGAETRDYLASVVESLKASKVDVNALGIDGLTNDTTIENLNALKDTDIEKILTSVISTIGTDKRDTYVNEKNLLDRDLKTSAMQNYGIEQNATMLDASIAAIDPEGDNKEHYANIQARMSTIMSQAVEAGVSEADLSAYGAAFEEVMALDPTSETFLEDLENIGISGLTTELLKAVELTKEIEEETEEWISEYNYLDQLSRQISQSQREKERAEKQYNRELEKGTLTAEKAMELTLAQTAALNKEANLNIQKWGEAARTLEGMTSKKKGAENQEFAKFVNYNAETGELKVDYEKANAAFADSPEAGAKFDEYVATLYELQAEAQDAQDSLDDISDQMDELKDQGKDEYSGLWNQVREAMISNQQAQIDKLSELNSSITDARAALVDQMQKQIEEERQMRENAETEENIANKEAQLAYLMRDTSGANSLQAMDLQSEIETEKQDYTDTLVDQAIANLQAGNEQAAAQRELQIEIAQAQLDAYANSQQSFQDAQTVLNYALSNEGSLGTGIASGLTGLGAGITGDISGLGLGIQTDFTNLGLGITGDISGVTGGLSSLGINMGMLMGPSGTLATDLTSLITQQNNLNSIEKAAAKQQVETDAANATVYATQNGYLSTSNQNESATNSNIINLGDKLKAQYDAWEIKEKEFVEANNSTITTAQTNIANELAANGAIATSVGGVKTAIGGLFTAEDEKAFLTTLNNEEAKKKWMQSFTAATKEDPLFKGYGTDLATIKENLTQEKEAKKAAEENEKKNKMAANYASLLTDSQKLSKESFKALQDSGYISKDKKYEDYATAHDKNTEATLKAEQSAQEKISTKTISGGKEQEKTETTTEIKDSDKVKWTNGWIGETDGPGKDHGFDLSRAKSGKNEWGDASMGARDILIGLEGTNDRAAAAAKEASIPANYNGSRKYRIFEFEGHYYAYVDGVAYCVEAEDEPWLEREFTRYKTGGLADFTGPAWLDGTKAHPEMVLNAKDTANFIELKDILADILYGTSTIKNDNRSQATNNNNFDISINIDSISDDYDVEQMVEKIKEILYEDSMYRNVNTINLTR